MTERTERRHALRITPTLGVAAGRARLRTGRELAVVQLSAIGALIESDVRLLPGTHHEIHFYPDGQRQLVRTRIVRCVVSALPAGGAVVYRAAVAFGVPLVGGLDG
ncbi:MAG: hypothetical protein AB7G23_04185 [Vicinamibacterales bacterium]